MAPPHPSVLASRLLQAREQLEETNEGVLNRIQEFHENLRDAHDELHERMQDVGRNVLKIATCVHERIHKRLFGFNDGCIYPPSSFPEGTKPRAMRAAALDKPPLKGDLKTIIVLVDFPNRKFAPNHTLSYFQVTTTACQNNIDA